MLTYSRTDQADALGLLAQIAAQDVEPGETNGTWPAGVGPSGTGEMGLFNIGASRSHVVHHEAVGPEVDETHLCSAATTAPRCRSKSVSGESFVMLPVITTRSRRGNEMWWQFAGENAERAGGRRLRGRPDGKRPQSIWPIQRRTPARNLHPQLTPQRSDVIAQLVMRRYATLSMAVVGAMLVLFLLAEALHVPLLTDAEPLGSDRGLLAAAAIGVALLIADVFLPVPSSVVMVANGALFGVVVGTALSLVGSVGAFAVGFGVGRRGAAVVARFVTADERERADRFSGRWGVTAIILSRPVPILAETVSFVAGTSVLGWRPAMGAATVGSVPAAILYAVAGSLAASFASTSVVFAVVTLLGVGAALVVRQRGAAPDGGAPL